MAGFYKWLNQKMANFLGDFKEEREPEENPSPTRGVCRILFVLVLITGFVLLLVYHFKVSPDVRVKLKYHLQDKNKAYVVNSFYSRDESTSGSPKLARRNPIVCPCSNISVPWKDFVSFYMLTENSTQWNVTGGSTAQNQSASTSPWISVPYLEGHNSSLLENHIIKDENILTAEKFCEKVLMWPIDNTTQREILDQQYMNKVCLWMASAVLPGSNQVYFEDRSTQFLESPILLNREVLNMFVAKRARESVLRALLELEMVNFASTTLARVYVGMADFLIGALDRFEMKEWESYYYGALDLSGNLDVMVSFGDLNPSLIFLYDRILKQFIFLHLEIDWMKYNAACYPRYCEETKPMDWAWQAYRAFGLLGGVTTLVVGVVTMILWPAAGILLGQCCKKSAASAGDPEHPKAPFLSNSGGSLSPAPQSHVPEASVVTNRSGSFLRRTGQKHSDP